MSEDERVRRALAVAEESPNAIVAVVGPTGSGKTALAVALAERLDGEILSVDSVQIYRHFDIGSGKPSEDELRRARHHLLSILDPLEPVDAARFASLAEAALADIRGRGKRPILCGGTFLWTKALLQGLAEAPAADPEIRARHRALVDAEGRPALHARLAAVDPACAARLHPNDLVRVSRALEVAELTGKPMSAWQAEHGFRSVRHEAQLVAIQHDAEELTRRIQARVESFFDAGWIEETRGLLDQGYGGARAMGAVGYREVRAHLAGELTRDELTTAVVRATRVFARRQRTWLNGGTITWV